MSRCLKLLVCLMAGASLNICLAEGSIAENECLQTPVVQEATTESNLQQNQKCQSSGGYLEKWMVANLSATPTNQHQTKNLSFQSNIGIGFLKFNNIRGNLVGKPLVTDFSPATQWRDAPLKYGITYNRTPLYEYILGYQFKTWLKAALSYQYQGGINIQTQAIWANPPAAQSADQRILFFSTLSLNGLFFKLYIESPYLFNFKDFVALPYVAVGVGPAWQSWTRMSEIYYRGNQFFVGGLMPLRNKIAANAAFTVDMGMRLQSPCINPKFTFVMGCKYNQWGQARNLGKMSQQGSHKLALSHPINIKVVNQFAPYLGVQWNFPNNFSPGGDKLYGRNINVNKPYFTKHNGFNCNPILYTQFNVGIGFLYFNGVKGNLMGQPAVNFLGGATFAGGFRDVPLKGRLSYNRTPLMEFLLGYRILQWMSAALSYQYQSGVSVQTQSLWGYVPAANSSSNFVRLISNLSLNGLMLKTYFNSPYAMILKNMSYTGYVAFGVGAGWQSWTDIDWVGNVTNTLFSGRTLPLRQKISANVIFNTDVGIRIQNALPNPNFSVRMGCKFNMWGQARNIGKMSQQGVVKKAISDPFRIKHVNQFAPYLGVQWNFANNFKQASYQLAGKSPNTWKPYFARRKLFLDNAGCWTQVNMGLGLLYFKGLRGNITGRPSVNFLSNTTQQRDSSIKGKLQYNRTPLFEYIFGYKIDRKMSVALSYQHQGGVNIQTQNLHGFPSAALSNSNYAQFRSNLSLDSIMVKFYFNFPLAMIMKSLSFSPYLGVGVGPGWQSWTFAQVIYTYANNAMIGDILRMRQKISANAAFMVDKGILIQSAHPNSRLAVSVGCKFNLWGQARSIGKMRQQGTHKQAIAQPVIIKTVYQFAPYLGVQWNF